MGVAHEESLKDYWDLRSSIKTYYKEGEEAGFKKGEEIGIRKKSIEIAKTALKEGVDLNTIARLTGLSISEIKALITDKP